MQKHAERYARADANKGKMNYLYWISKESNNKITDKRFLRQEPFA